MKPDWEDAPEWAKFVAMDSSGSWYWFEEEPFIRGNQWWTDCGSMQEVDLTWETTKEARP